MAELMTEAEHKAMDLTADLWNLMVQEVIADGATADQDRCEFAAQIHAIQHTILRQAAARAYPDRYRLLGSTFADRTDSEQLLRAIFSNDPEEDPHP